MNINDIRTLKDFKGKSFSKFKKSEVIKEYIASVLKNKIEPACNWCAELICSGHYVALWDTILLIIGKYIHIGNPKLPIYCVMRYNQFKEILENGYIDNELALRNNETIRTLFGEITIILCLSNKKPGIESIKIKKNEFNSDHLANKFKAPNISYAKTIFKDLDPKELFIAINELSFQIDEKDNLLECCYWIEWIIEYDQLCKRNKNQLKAESRSFAPIKYQTDTIWIIWELFLSKTKNDLQKKCIDSLITLFSLKYTNAVKKRRKFLLYFALQILIENVDFSLDIIKSNNKPQIEHILNNLYKIYKTIKSNEITPKTDYLFKGLSSSKSNLEKTVEKLDIMKQLT